MKKKLKIFTDFDATISINDVGDKLFEQYVIDDWKRPIQEWREGKISSKEVFIRECAMTRITKEQMIEFCNQQPIDPYFKEFITYCQTQNYPVAVLSDGLDFYINRILKNNGLDFLPVYSNKIIFEAPDRIRPEFPYYGLGCPNCANCKGYHVQENQQNGETIVYIGDGLSDRCGAKHADIIFAKDDLKDYCIENNISFYDFKHFGEIIKKLPTIVS